MIRRETQDDFILIAQNDHAVLSGELAQHIGGPQFSRPDPLAPALAGISLHDCGWPLHDDAPTLNARHLPLDVFETPPAIATRVWSASVEGACACDPYAGLLVSLHVLRLSDLTIRICSRPDMFAFIQFQQRQIEIQSKLRASFGLRGDLPLTLGLTPLGASDDDDRLRFNARLLQAMDTISLMLCCTELLFPEIAGIPARPGGLELTMHLARDSGGILHVDPWPFDLDELTCDIPCRRMKKQVFADQSDFRLAFAAAARDSMQVRLHI